MNELGNDLGEAGGSFHSTVEGDAWAIRGDSMEVHGSPLVWGNAKPRDDGCVVGELLNETRDWALVLPGSEGIMSGGGAGGDGMDTGVGGLSFLIGP
ncbi:UNVERIFIED_CONTAM: hypothetical protein Sradi_1996700 [Sesamum radiatum]|uniref:Uncharacterized protein n=1 Tax=Sesamum radiatum TaxID=300843 RepID=A0AAW2TFR4_SESRA